MNTLPVNFHGNTLHIIDHNSEPYTPMKPIVEGMGLDWRSQQAKVSANPQRYGMVKITIPVNGMVSTQEMLCIPLRKLFGWLCTISPNKVKPELKGKIIQYQNECDEVLYQHWTQKEKEQQHPQTFSVEEMTPSDRSISFNRHECTPITSADGRHWLAAHQLNSLLGYKRRDVAAMLYGKNAEKFEPSQVARISYETRTRTERVLAFEASAWAQIASYSQCTNMSEFIRMAHEFATDRISIPKEEWDQIKHHASKGEEQYRKIAKASSDLVSTIGEGQMTFGISKILTQKH